MVRVLRLSMELSNEVLGVNQTKTTLMLGGVILLAVPPDLLISISEGFVPLQGDTIKNLTSILPLPKFLYVHEHTHQNEFQFYLLLYFTWFVSL